MKIRPAADRDLPALKHLYDERAALLGERVRSGREPSWLQRESGGVWVGENDGGIGGYVSAVRLASGRWIIDQMALDAHVYHPGMGRALVGAVCDMARRDGAAELLACVPLNYPVEQAFWRTLGAVPVVRHSRPGYQWMRLRL